MRKIWNLLKKPLIFGLPLGVVAAFAYCYWKNQFGVKDKVDAFLRKMKLMK